MVNIDENEKKLVEAIIEFQPTLFKTQLYLYETYNIDSYYDSETNLFRIIPGGINESTNAVKAKKYAEDVLYNCNVNVVFE